MIRWLVIFCIACTAALAAAPQSASAHEVRPAYLSAVETSQDKWQIIWKQPVLEGKRLKVAPAFQRANNGALAPCEWKAEARENLAATTIERGTLRCPIALISIDGLERTLTDAIVDVHPLDEEARTALLRPDARQLDLRKAADSPASAYLALGIEHILLGWDHLLFVIALVILIARPRQILGVITAFTIAHSATLSLAALGFLGVPSRPVEILIAASIVLLALEIISKQRGSEGLVTQRPYLVAVAVGLVHGLGFAGALSDIGLPEGTELLALFMFNIGVELGQVGVICAVLAALWALDKMTMDRRGRAVHVFAYIAGSIGLFWVIERLAGYL